MNNNKNNVIQFSNKHFIEFPSIPEEAKNILLIGSWKNIFGELHLFSDDKYDVTPEMGWPLRNMLPLVNFLKKKHKLTLYCDKQTIEYFNRLLTLLDDLLVFKNAGIDNVFKYVTAISHSDVKSNNNTLLNELLKWFNNKKEKNMKFDMIIQNPPYSGDLHLDFFEMGCDLLSEKGKMVIIEPATWLINVRRNGKARKYDMIKKKIEGHVESVVVENMNNEFGIEQQLPLATTTIDMGKFFSVIDFKCFGEHRVVTSIYDCNMIGSYNVIQSILTKCQNFGDVMNQHITTQNMGDGVFYIKCSSDILGRGFCSDGKRALSDATYQKINNNFYHINYVGSCYHHKSGNCISDVPFEKNDSNGNKIQGTISGNIYGTKEELENWKHFIFNNKLPLFLNIVLTIDQHNNSKYFVPWLVDRQYTDDEINELFCFTEEEIKLIEVTLKKYERRSPWFRRYLGGKDAATDEEVNNFIREISK